MKKSTVLLLLILIFAVFFRIYKLNDFPPGLYSDEAAYGYNAYSLLKTGSDEHGESWPLALKSFGDFKPPMTVWLTIPSVAFFGLTEFAVRLPSALAGVISVVGIYYLVKELFYNGTKLPIFGKKHLAYLPITTALLLTISPWHLLFSRSSMLVGIELMFITWGLLFFLKTLKRQNYLYPSSICFVGAIYTYYGSRITVPLLVVGLFLIFRKELWKLKRTLFLSALLGLILIIPLIFAISKETEILTGRAKTVSIFYDAGIESKLWEAHTLNGPNFPPLIGRFFHNKLYFYFKDFSRRYLQHFSADFLLITGDPHPPFDIPRMGNIYLFDAIFILFGLFLVIAKIQKRTLSLLLVLAVAPIASSFTFVTPAANRSFLMVIGITILSAIGVIYFIDTLTHKFKISWKLVALFILVLYTVSFSHYLNNYFIATTLEIPEKWHYGRKELVKKVTSREDSFQKVVISNKGGPSYVWLLFYKQYQPQSYWQSVKVNYTPDEYGFIHVESFNKYNFLREIVWNNLEKESDVLYVGFQDEIPLDWIGQIDGVFYKMVNDDQVNYPNGDTAFKLAHLELL